MSPPVSGLFERSFYEIGTLAYLVRPALDVAKIIAQFRCVQKR